MYSLQPDTIGRLTLLIVSRPSNYTLGLGYNQIKILVVDVTHTDPWILNTYTLNIYREMHDSNYNTEGIYYDCVLRQVRST